MDFFRFELFLNSSRCNGHCLCDSAQARQLKQQLRRALVAGQWRGDTALTLRLFWRRSTVSPAFFGRYPRSSLHSFVPPLLPVPVPNKPSRFCGRKAKWFARCECRMNGSGVDLLSRSRILRQFVNIVKHCDLVNKMPVRMYFSLTHK